MKCERGEEKKRRDESNDDTKSGDGDVGRGGRKGETGKAKGDDTRKSDLEREREPPQPRSSGQRCWDVKRRVETPDATPWFTSISFDSDVQEWRSWHCHTEKRHAISIVEPRFVVELLG